MHLQDLMQKEKIDLFLTLNSDSVVPNTTMAYLSGYSSSGILALPQRGKSVLYVPALEVEKAKKVSQSSVHLWKGSALEALQKTFKNAEVIGYESERLSVAHHEKIKKIFKVKTKPMDELIDQAKVIKNKREQEIYEEASPLTDKIVKSMINNFSSFKTEADVSAFLTQETAKYGCVPSFSTIVASGKNASQPHYEPKVVNLQKGFCVVDFGILYKNYCTDIARTLYIGNPSKKERLVYEKVRNVQEECIDKSQEGVKCSDIHNHAANKLGSAFCHALGHGIGVDVHESPNLSPKSSYVLKEGTYFTIEPGVYYPGKFGIRIEDDLAILKGKTRVLSKVTKELITV